MQFVTSSSDSDLNGCGSGTRVTDYLISMRVRRGGAICATPWCARAKALQVSATNSLQPIGAYRRQGLRIRSAIRDTCTRMTATSAATIVAVLELPGRLMKRSELGN